jgi:hypothetical protein
MGEKEYNKIRPNKKNLNLVSTHKFLRGAELIYLTDPSDLVPPVYISEGLKWLEDKLAEKKQDFLATAPMEAKND